MKKDSDKQAYTAKNVGKLINMWKRFFDDWAHDELADHGYDYFRMGYMPFIMNISEGGSTNNEIAAKAKVTKQAMSKVTKELMEHGLIQSEKHEEDGRSTVIFLTPKGKKLITDTKRSVALLAEEYKGIVGERNFEILLDSMYKIVEYHESKTQNRTLRVF